MNALIVTPSVFEVGAPYAFALVLAAPIVYIWFFLEPRKEAREVLLFTLKCALGYFGVALGFALSVTGLAHLFGSCVL